jgi:hypothetical protein
MHDKKCSQTCVGLGCRSDTDCPVGECCGREKICTEQECVLREGTVSGQKGETVSRIVLGILGSLVAGVLFFGVACNALKRKAAMREAAHQSDENVQHGSGRTIEQQGDEPESQPEEDEPEQTVHTQNPDHPPPPYPGPLPPSYSTLFPVPV